MNSCYIIQHTVNQIHLRLVVLEVLSENLLGDLDTQHGDLLTNVGNGSLLLLFDGGLRLVQQSGTFTTGLRLSLFHNSVARLGSLFQNLSLLLASLLQDGFTFLLDIRQTLLGLVGLAKRPSIKFLRSSTIPVMTGKPNLARRTKTTKNAINIQKNNPKSGVKMAGKLIESICTDDFED